MEQCWRWFGPQDPIGLDHIRQAGATGIVSALHGHPEGSAWPLHELLRRKSTVEAAGLRWSVCESIPMPSDVKLRSGACETMLGAWKDSLAAVARAGIAVVNYNFMPVVDWTRTDLRHRLPTTGYALRFDMVDFVGYDVFVLRRRDAADDYEPRLVEEAGRRSRAWDEAAVHRLEATVIAGLPGADDTYSREGVAREIARFDGVDADALRSNLFAFVREMAPVAEDLGIRLCVHPDDPPFPLFGLPRVVSTGDDLRAIVGCEGSRANGVTLCTGSLGARPDNDLPALARELGPHIHFAHLRNVTRERDGSFHEAEHLDGDVDMVGVVFALEDEEARRRAEGRADATIPMRPDHGHLLANDIRKADEGLRVNPGYSYAGRLKGLAELRGVMRAHGRSAAAASR